MSISREDFNKQILKFIGQCKRLDDDWQVLVVEEGKQPRNFSIDITDATILKRQQLMLAKNEVRQNGQLDIDELINYEYTVIYSDSYETPVMYFNASDQCGSLVGLEKTMLNISERTSSNLQSIVNQVEHPILFRPFYMIHPCKTQDFMKFHEGDVYLVTWLSTVGTLLNLKLHPAFGKIDY